MARIYATELDLKKKGTIFNKFNETQKLNLAQQYFNCVFYFDAINENKSLLKSFYFVSELFHFTF